MWNIRIYIICPDSLLSHIIPLSMIQNDWSIYYEPGQKKPRSMYLDLYIYIYTPYFILVNVVSPCPIHVPWLSPRCRGLRICGFPEDFTGPMLKELLDCCGFRGAPVEPFEGGVSKAPDFFMGKFLWDLMGFHGKFLWDDWWVKMIFHGIFHGTLRWYLMLGFTEILRWT